MRLSILAFLVALPAVAYAAASPQGTQDNECVNQGDLCADDGVSPPCCYGLECKPLTFSLPPHSGIGPEVINVRHSASALFLADRCIRFASNKSLFSLCVGGGTGKGSRRGWVGFNESAFLNASSKMKCIADRISFRSNHVENKLPLFPADFKFALSPTVQAISCQCRYSSSKSMFLVTAEEEPWAFWRNWS